MKKLVSMVFVITMFSSTFCFSAPLLTDIYNNSGMITSAAALVAVIAARHMSGPLSYSSLTPVFNPDNLATKTFFSAFGTVIAGISVTGLRLFDGLSGGAFTEFWKGF